MDRPLNVANGHAKCPAGDVCMKAPRLEGSNSCAIKDNMSNALESLHALDTTIGSDV